MSDQRHGAITDVAGVRVGHHERLDDHWATGVSVVLVPDGAVAAVDVRGGGPGTRETDVLAPTHLVQQVQAVVLTGGSAYGLASADGVMRWLAERRYGLPVGAQPHEVVPVVPAAVLFDVPMSDWGNRPDASFGYAACDAAGTDTREGNVGAGTGAVAGGVKGGLGTASAVLPGGATVGALVAVNSSGSPIDLDTGLPWTLDTQRAGDFGLRAPSDEDIAAGRERLRQRPSRHGGPAQAFNTTIGVVATDLALTKAECHRVAVTAHDGLARAIRPVHAMFDGDTVFALSTGARQPETSVAEVFARAKLVDEICATAADVMARAIVRAILAAGPVGAVPSYFTSYPSARH